MPVKKKHKNNAERQAAYRKRHRNAKATVTPPIPPAVAVKDCWRRVYLCQGVHGPLYAEVVQNPWCPPGRCVFCDTYRTV